MQEIAVLAARAMGVQRQFTAVADNIANVNTVGYRKVDVEFKEYLTKPKLNGGNAAELSYVEDRGVFISSQDGALQKTGNPFDVALSGNGFFAIDVNGTTQYTRRGNFMLDAEGTLVTSDGAPVLDNAGAAIQLPPDTKSLTVARDGTLSTEQGQIAQLGVFSFSKEDMKLLQRTGSSAFLPREGIVPQIVEAPRMMQGFLEASNVNPTEEMVNMENVSRAYQNSMKLMQRMEDLEQKAIRTLGQI